MDGSDWYGWHDDYARSGSTLVRRLVAVQQRIRTALDTAPAGPAAAGEDAGFAREWVSDPAEKYGVGVHRYAGEPQPLPTGVPMFTFVR